MSREEVFYLQTVVSRASLLPPDPGLLRSDVLVRKRHRVLGRVDLPYIDFAQEPYEMPVKRGYFSWQGKHDTCRVHAIINGLLAMNIVPDEESIHEWVKLSESQGGTIVELANSIKCLRRNHHPPAEFELFSNRLMNIRSGYNALKQGDVKQFEGIVRQNGQLIRSIFDERPQSVLLFGVISRRYTGKAKHKGSHAFAVDGYRIKRKNGRGQMQVHIVDSSIGKYWLSIERLTYALKEESDFPNAREFIHPVCLMRKRED